MAMLVWDARPGFPARAPGEHAALSALWLPARARGLHRAGLAGCAQRFGVTCRPRKLRTGTTRGIGCSVSGSTLAT